MHLINTPSAAAGNQFTNGNPVEGIPPTIVDDTWLNSVQNEIANVITENGIVLSTENDAQLYAAINAMIVRPPFWRTREYLGGSLVPDTLDASYFQDGTGAPGANFPAVTQSYFTRYAAGPGGGIVYETPGVGLVLWGRIGIKNVTTNDVTVNYRIYAWDNCIRMVYDGATLQLNPSSGTWNTIGTFVVPAGTTKTLEVFFRNSAASYDPSNQGVLHLMMDAFDNPALQFVDAGK